MTALDIRATDPYGFRSGEWARLTGVEWANDRPCYRVRFPDGAEDSWVVNDPSDPYEFRPQVERRVSPERRAEDRKELARLRAVAKVLAFIVREYGQTRLDFEAWEQVHEALGAGPVEGCTPAECSARLLALAKGGVA